MNSLYKQSYLSSIGFTKFITGIHYLIELLALQYVIEPFSLESLQPYFSSKELLMILSSKSLTHSSATYFKPSLLEKLHEAITSLERKSDSEVTLDSLSKELAYLNNLLDEASDQEDEIARLEHYLQDAMDNDNFEQLKELYKLIDEAKMKDRFYLQAKIDELEIKLEQYKRKPKVKLDENNNQLISLTQLIDRIADKKDSKQLRQKFRKWLVENEYIKEVKDGKSLLYEVTNKGKEAGVVAKVYSGKFYNSTAIFMKSSSFMALIKSLDYSGQLKGGESFK